MTASEHDLEPMSEDAVHLSYTSQLPFPFNIYTSDVAIISNKWRTVFTLCLNGVQVCPLEHVTGKIEHLNAY